MLHSWRPLVQIVYDATDAIESIYFITFGGWECFRLLVEVDQVIIATAGGQLQAAGGHWRG